MTFYAKFCYPLIEFNCMKVLSIFVEVSDHFGMSHVHWKRKGEKGGVKSYYSSNFILPMQSCRQLFSSLKG